MDRNVTAVIAKHSNRAERGLQKYGVDTTRTDLSFADWLSHLQEELMDAAVYIERLLQESAKVKRLEQYPAVIKQLRERQFTDQRVCDDIERLVDEAAAAGGE